jgi:diaminopimelate epimerase
MLVPFIKMHGAGNDFVVLDNRKSTIVVAEINMQKIADRQFGIGCDQVAVLEASKKADVFMRIFNADGSQSASCGNASRCIGWLLFAERNDETDSHVTIETTSAVIVVTVSDDQQITVDMGEPYLEWQNIPLAEPMDTLHLNITEGELSDPVAVSMGNPHAVFFVAEPYNINLPVLGSALEHHPLFPQRANIGVARIESKTHITLRVWERGAGATLACGTGACAALVAAHRRGLTRRKAMVDLPGGTLIIEWRESDNHVLMSGPAESSFVGTFNSESYAL